MVMQVEMRAEMRPEMRALSEMKVQTQKPRDLSKVRSTIGKAQVKLTSAGQPFLSSGRCIATGRAGGKVCGKPRGADGVPYCTLHMKTGDPSLKVVAHPRAGKILVAARTLPKGYRMALWGLLRKPKNMTEQAMEWAFKLGDGRMLDPTDFTGSMVQFCACPGPNEAAAMQATSHQEMKKEYGSWVFCTREQLPQSWQLTMQYGNTSKQSEEFFAERGIKRLDVGTRRNPVLRRKDKPLPQ